MGAYLVEEGGKGHIGDFKQSINHSINQSAIHPFNHSSMHLSNLCHSCPYTPYLHPPIHSELHQSTHPAISHTHPSIHSFFHSSASICPLTHPSIYPSVHLSIHTSIHGSTSGNIMAQTLKMHLICLFLHPWAIQTLHILPHFLLPTHHIIMATSLMIASFRQSKKSLSGRP